jgi:hypothetical protein
LGDPFGAEEVKLLNNSETRSRFHGAKEGWWSRIGEVHRPRRRKYGWSNGCLGFDGVAMNYGMSTCAMQRHEQLQPEHESTRRSWGRPPWSCSGSRPVRLASRYASQNSSSRFIGHSSEKILRFDLSMDTLVARSPGVYMSACNMEIEPNTCMLVPAQSWRPWPNTDRFGLT